MPQPASVSRPSEDSSAPASATLTPSDPLLLLTSFCISHHTNVHPSTALSHRNHRRRCTNASSLHLALRSSLSQPFHPRTQRLLRTQRNCGTTVAMAMSMKRNSSSSSNCSVRSYASSSGETRATCYAVSLRDAAVHGFHYSTTGAAGVEWWA